MDQDEDNSSLDSIANTEEMIDDFLCYTNRLRELLKAIGNEEGLNIECGPKSFERVQTSVKYLTVVLIYEILQVLKDKQKIRFKNEYIDEALSKMLGKSDAFGISLKKIHELQEQLEDLNQQAAINKAMDYINIIEPFKKEV